MQCMKVTENGLQSNPKQRNLKEKDQHLENDSSIYKDRKSVV